jgi:hypothetical protein
MKIKSLVAHFSAQETVPIEIDQVIDQLRIMGVEAEIYYWAADINKDILRGQITHWDYPDNNGTLHPVVDIDYSKHLSIDWQRLVICKELLHILDIDAARVNTPEKVKHLINRIVLPPELSESAKDGLCVISDKFAVYQSVAILFPNAARKLLKPDFDAQRLTINDISRLLCMPPRYIT